MFWMCPLTALSLLTIVFYYDDNITHWCDSLHRQVPLHLKVHQIVVSRQLTRCRFLTVLMCFGCKRYKSFCQPVICNHFSRVLLLFKAAVVLGKTLFLVLVHHWLRITLQHSWMTDLVTNICMEINIHWMIKLII